MYLLCHSNGLLSRGDNEGEKWFISKGCSMKDDKNIIFNVSSEQVNISTGQVNIFSNISSIQCHLVKF